MAVITMIKVLAGVGKHQLFFFMPTDGAGNN
jgi:hypothetical protein